MDDAAEPRTGAAGGALLSVRPSWWNYARWFALFFVVIPVTLIVVARFLPPLLGMSGDLTSYLPFVVLLLLVFYLVPPLWAHLDRLALELRVYDDRLVLERGILSKETKELFVEDIRSIDTRQGVIQRIVGTGDLMVASSGTDQYEYVVEGIPDPDGVKQLIVAQRQGAPPGG